MRLLTIHSPFLNGSMCREDLVQTIHVLRDLGADLTICDHKNNCTLTNVCIPKTSTLLSYFLDNLVYSASTC